MIGVDLSLTACFPELRDRHFGEQGVIAGFAYLHPWIDPEVFPVAGSANNHENVWIDTELSSEQFFVSTA